MQYQHKEQKIYSRPRIDLSSGNGRYKKRKLGFKRFSNFKNGIKKYNQYSKNEKKIILISFALVISIITFFAIWNSINPIFERLCEDKAKSVATIITNEETTNVMKKYNYDTFFTIEKDEKGRIQLITENVLKVNLVISDITSNIQKRIEENEKKSIYISSGSITGIRFLSGIGPKIPLKISCSGNIDTDLRSEFISKGVNQTLHRVYLDIKTNVNILTSFNTIEKTIENQILILENVIVGEIPETYYNFEGTNMEEEALRVIE